MSSEIKRGSMVRSICGHDAGTLLVVSEINEPYAVLLDGKRRPITRPKRKKIKHTQLILAESPLTSSGCEWTNRAIRKAIRYVAEVANTDLMKEDWHGKR